MQYTFEGSYALQSSSVFAINDPIALGQAFNVYNHLRAARAGELGEDDIDWLALKATLLALAMVKGQRPPALPGEAESE